MIQEAYENDKTAYLVMGKDAIRNEGFSQVSVLCC